MSCPYWTKPMLVEKVRFNNLMCCPAMDTILRAVIRHDLCAIDSCTEV